MRRSLMIAGIALIAIGKVFLVFGIFALEDMQKCRTLDRSMIEGLTRDLTCTDHSINYFVVSITFLAAGAIAFVYGWKSKLWDKDFT